MAFSKSSASICGLFHIFNLLFFTFGTSQALPVVTPAAAPTPANPAPGNGGQCPQLDVCFSLLDDLIISGGQVPKEPCCSLINGLLGLDAALCLCLQIKAKLLGITAVKLNLDVKLLLNECGKQVPEGFQCPN